MPYYPDEIVDEVRQRSDIVDVISSYVNLKKSGSTYFGLCPFHNEKTGSFSVTPSKQMFYCFGCHEGGNVFNFIMKYENCDFNEALTMLADRSGVKLPEVTMSAENKREADKKALIYEIYKEAGTYYYKLLRSPKGEVAYKYFKGRGLSDETMQKFGLGYSDKVSGGLYAYLKGKGYSDEILRETGLVSYDEKRGFNDKFWNRAMFPIMNEHSKVVAFGGRVFGDAKPKYLNSPETAIFNKSRTLYGLHLARRTRRDQLILCEGYMDVIALHQAGFDNAVASLGTALTEGHADVISRLTRKVYLCYDSDDAGINAAMRAIPILKNHGISCRIINMSPYKDPDEFIKGLGAEAFEERIRDAENSFIFSVRIMQKGYDMSDPDDRTAFDNEVAGRLAAIADAMERENYLVAVSARFSIPERELRTRVNQIGNANMGGITAGRNSYVRQKEKNVREDPVFIKQKQILTWLVEHPGLYPVISEYISWEDFTEGVYQQMAKALWMQLAAGRDPDPAAISQTFYDEEDQRLVAEICHNRVEGLKTDGDWDKTIKTALILIKKQGDARRLEQADEKDKLNMAIENKKNITRLEKQNLNITAEMLAD